MGRGYRVIFPLTPSIALPGDSDIGASPCCVVSVEVAVRPVRRVLRANIVVLTVAAIAFTFVLDETEKKDNDDAFEAISVRLLFLAGAGVELVEGGKGFTPSAASISLLHNVENESCVSALRTSLDCAIQSSLTPVSSSRSVFVSAWQNMHMIFCGKGRRKQLRRRWPSQSMASMSMAEGAAVQLSRASPESNLAENLVHADAIRLRGRSGLPFSIAIDPPAEAAQPMSSVATVGLY